MSAFDECGALATTWGRPAASSYLPDAFAADPDRSARFQREAHVLASLNHPNIAQIYGTEEDKTDGTRALVLELVEGPTLADRIAEGPIPLDEALPIAKQIAEALEAAHESGVIHRDLKPANIKVREDGTVKVLDFGLAKALRPGGSDPSDSPTLTAAATQMGVILGTAAYMSPEQATGRPVDRRTDIWAFGAVLFEMLTGRRAFAGSHVSNTLASVLTTDVDWSMLPPRTPRSVHNVLIRCLVREPKQRIRDIGDALLAMEGAFETTVATPSAPGAAPQLSVWRRSALTALVAVLVAGLTGTAVWRFTRPDAATTNVMRFVISPSDPTPVDFSGGHSDLALTVDGTQVIYQTRAPGGGRQLAVRPIGEFVGEALRGSEGSVGPFVSPNGEWVGSVDDANRRVLRKVSIGGGSPVTLAEFPRPILGATWRTDDQIIVGTFHGGLFRVSGGGGEPEALTTPDVDHGETAHSWPYAIPGRQAVLFGITVDNFNADQIAVLSLASGEVTRLGLVGLSPRYVSTGHLVYAVQDGSVRAVPFDVASLTITGTPVPVVEDVAVKFSGAANFSISDNGHLVYSPGGGAYGGRRSLVWVDRNGREEPLAAPPRLYQYARISPDGTRVALDLRDGESDVWIWDLARETLQRLTTWAGPDNYGLWTPDGDRVVFESDRAGDGTNDVYWQAADFSGGAVPLTEHSTALAPNAISPDGSWLIVRAGRQAPYDLSVLSLDEARPWWARSSMS